ncbi:MarR family transcriptional regulator [Streptomyces sp. NPDC059533]|uniref:GbsR/MarR family transcriptional regulator n=1 Tax=unclassified Streptomyces TaxID=2593676 RepID=UPI0036AF3F9C
MPGGRLTQEDRRLIAAGLADDLSYNEIAKRLDRAASTVTREVMRNGGPNDYQADRAQHATARRARRRKRMTGSPATRTVAPPDPYGRDPQTLRGFEQRFTEVLVDSGLPRMVAGVLGCLYTTDTGSLTAGELAERLRVSPASVSKAVGYLTTQGLIRRERDAGGRRDRYVIDEDIWFHSLEESSRLNSALADVAREGAGLLGADTPAGGRLDCMGRFLGHVGEDLARAARYWRQVFAARRATSTDPA